MIYQSEQMEERAVLQTAARMCAAARTAPKAHGKSITVFASEHLWEILKCTPNDVVQFI
ncbi:MAG: hypothetical protein PHE09_09700 [Oscillospiraceae bacterium]|nr:hypothetical protein [Oscillospiraceae bacterium]